MRPKPSRIWRSRTAFHEPSVGRVTDRIHQVHVNQFEVKRDFLANLPLRRQLSVGVSRFVCGVYRKRGFTETCLRRHEGMRFEEL